MHDFVKIRKIFRRMLGFLAHPSRQSLIDFRDSPKPKPVGFSFSQPV
jgi:hypothetical protein